MDLCERIDEARERWNVLRHPFYTRWERGELTRDELVFYAGEYRHPVVALAETAAAAGDAEHAREEAEHVLFVPPANELLSTMLEIVPLQLLAYYIATCRGCEVDQPRNLAKSVTVE